MFLSKKKSSGKKAFDIVQEIVQFQQDEGRKLDKRQENDKKFNEKWKSEFHNAIRDMDVFEEGLSSAIKTGYKDSILGFVISKKLNQMADNQDVRYFDALENIIILEKSKNDSSFANRFFNEYEKIREAKKKGSFGAGVNEHIKMIKGSYVEKKQDIINSKIKIFNDHEFSSDFVVKSDDLNIDSNHNKVKQEEIKLSGKLIIEVGGLPIDFQEPEVKLSGNPTIEIGGFTFEAQ